MLPGRVMARMECCLSADHAASSDCLASGIDITSLQQCFPCNLVQHPGFTGDQVSDDSIRSIFSRLPSRVPAEKEGRAVVM